jgi:hypothetical protein
MCPQALQRGIAGPPHILRPTIDAELGGQHDFTPPAGDGLADQHLVGERSVRVGGVEEVDAQVEGPVDGGDTARTLRFCLNPLCARYIHEQTAWPSAPIG